MPRHLMTYEQQMFYHGSVQQYHGVQVDDEEEEISEAEEVKDITEQEERREYLFQQAQPYLNLPQYRRSIMRAAIREQVQRTNRSNSICSGENSNNRRRRNSSAGRGGGSRLIKSILTIQKQFYQEFHLTNNINMFHN